MKQLTITDKPRVTLVVLGHSVAFGAFYAGYIDGALAGYYYDGRPPILNSGHPAAPLLRRAA